MNNSLPVSVVRPRGLMMAADEPPTRPQVAAAFAAFVFVAALTLIANAGLDFSTAWVPLLPFIIASVVTLIFSVRLENGVYIGFATTSLLTFALVLGFERAVLVGMVAFAVAALFLLASRRLGISASAARGMAIEGLYVQSTLGLIILLVGWVYRDLIASDWLGPETVFLIVTSLFFMLALIRTALWVRLRGVSIGQFITRSWYLLLINNFLALGLAPLIAPRLTESLASADGALLYLFGLILLTVVNNAYLEVTRRLAHLTALNNIGRALTANLEFDDLLQTFRHEVGQLLDVSGFYLALYNANTDVISFPIDYEDGLPNPPSQTTMGTRSLTEYVIRSREPLLLAHNSEEFLEHYHIQSLSRVGKSYLGVPIINRNQVTGVLALRSFEREYAFNADDVKLMQNIAAQAGVALRNAQLYRDSSRRASELSSLNQVTSLLAASTDLNRLIDTVCEMVIQVMGYDKAAVFLLDLDGRTARLVASVGLGDDFRATAAVLSTEESRAEVFRTGRPVVIPDIFEEERFKDVLPRAQAENFRAILEIPLVIGSSVIGSVAAYHAQPRQIGSDEIELLHTLGGLIAVAVENARLFEATSSRGHELATLYEASESLNSSLSLKNVLRALSLTLIQALRVSSCSTWLTSESELALRATLHMIGVEGGGNEEPFKPLEIALDDLPNVRRAMKLHAPTFVRAGQPDLSIGSRRLLDHCHLDHALLLPLEMHGKLVGLLAIAPPAQQAEFKPEQIRIAGALGAQAAVAIDNARRFERTDAALAKRLDELSALEHLSRRMAGHLDMQTVIDEVAQAAIGATGVEYIDVALLDATGRTVRSILRHAAFPEKDVPNEWPAYEGLTGRALRSRQSARVGDVAQDADYRMARPDVQSELVVPITLEGEIIGVLNLESTRLNAFTEEHERFVANLAEHAAVAIANARLYESERRQRHIAEILLETGAAVTSSPSLSEVLVTLARQLIKISGFDGCSILQWDEDTGQVYALAEHTRCLWPHGGQSYPVRDFPATAAVLASGKPVAIYPGMPDPDHAELALMEEIGLVIELMFRLMSGKKSIGVVEITASTPNLNMARAAQDRYQRVLKEASGWLVDPLESNSPESLLDLARSLAEITPYTNCVLSSLDESGQQVTHHLIYGDLVWQPGRGPSRDVADFPGLAEVLESGNSRVARAGESDIRPISDRVAKWGVHTLITQPFVSKGHPIGIVELFEIGDRPSFNEEDLRLWRLVGDQAAVAIENANLFEAIQRRGEEFSALRSMAVELLSSLDLKENLRTILRHAVERTGAQEVFIYLYDQAHDQLTFGASLTRDGQVDLQTAPPRPHGITATVAHTGETQIATDLPHHPLFADVYADPYWHSIKSVIGMPLKSSGRIVGVFTAVFSDRPQPGPEVIHFLDLLAAQAAVAIENTRLAEEMRTGRDRLESVLNSSHDGLMMLDTDGRLVLANPRTEYLLNIRMSDMTRRHFLNIMQRIGETLDEGERDAWLQDALEVVGAIRENPLVTTRRRYTLGGASIHSIEETSTAVVAADDEVLGRLFVLHDVTDQVELEAYRQEIASMIVHDLRSPLGSLITGLDMALAEVNEMPEGPHTEPLKMTLGVGLNSANTLLGLVEAILDINKLESGEMPLNLRPVNLAQIAEVARERLASSAAQAQIEVTLHVPRHLPEITADLEKIERVIVNLLDNALRYTPRGGKIKIHVQAKPTHHMVTVSDNGEGIPLEYRERVFERFYQIRGQGRKRGSKGSGLGLTFCRLAVEAHRGKIWVDDSPEGGAAFHFTLPTNLSPGADAA